jgi:hypothetical protein
VASRLGSLARHPLYPLTAVVKALTFWVHMRARWASFAVGLWLLVAPLVLGYPNVWAVLHDVALGLLVSVGTLAAMEWPLARFALVIPAAWLLRAADSISWPSPVISANELACGVVVFALALFPNGRLAASRAPAKMAA